MIVFLLETLAAALVMGIIILIAFAIFLAVTDKPENKPWDQTWTREYWDKHTPNNCRLLRIVESPSSRVYGSPVYECH